jgi:hypothetical protein
MMKLKIIKCSTTRWYMDSVGELVDYVPRYDDSTQYGSRDQGGYINFVLREDAEIVEVAE